MHKHYTDTNKSRNKNVNYFVPTTNNSFVFNRSYKMSHTNKQTKRIV